MVVMTPRKVKREFLVRIVICLAHLKTKLQWGYSNSYTPPVISFNFRCRNTSKLIVLTHICFLTGDKRFAISLISSPKRIQLLNNFIRVNIKGEVCNFNVQYLNIFLPQFYIYSHCSVYRYSNIPNSLATLAQPQVWGESI